jgi:hypothetical protein
VSRIRRRSQHEPVVPDDLVVDPAQQARAGLHRFRDEAAPAAL